MKINEIISSVDKDEILEIFNKYFKTNANAVIDIDDIGYVSCDHYVTSKNICEFNILPIKFKFINGSFSCNENRRLTSLIGFPDTLMYNTYCYGNGLKTLKGGPTSVNGIFNCSDNQLSNLEGCPYVTYDLNICNNPLESLNGLKSDIRRIFLTYTPTLPLLKCLTAKTIKFDPTGPLIKQIQYVLNKYAGQGRKAALDCAADLLSLGKKLGIDLTMNARW